MRLLQDLKKRSNPGYSNAPEIAMVYAALGDRDQALNWLERGYQERFNPGVLLRQVSILYALMCDSESFFTGQAWAAPSESVRSCLRRFLD